ncbi:MAG: restriction endonuclease subunit S, partial [Bacteroidetes bacterium]|nr:restriction endonuclease subunit S [Bacteroidota bacterium]
LFKDVQVGMSRERLSKAKIERFIIPMPPPDEQKRIIAKVDELMGLCEELEKGLIKSRENMGKVLKSVVSRE